MSFARFSRLVVTLGLAGASIGLGACGQRSLPAIKDSGDYNYRYGRYDEAEMEYKEYLQRSPGKADVQAQMGRTYLAKGESKLAVEHLHVAHGLALENDEIFRSLCDALLADKQLDDLNRMLRSRTADRGRVQDWALLAEFSEKQGDRDEAQRAWLTAAQVDGGTTVLPQLGLARLYYSIGDIPRAKRRAAMAYYVDPLNRDVNELVKQLGEVPGPTFGVPPAETGASAPQPGEAFPRKWTPIATPQTNYNDPAAMPPSQNP